MTVRDAAAKLLSEGFAVVPIVAGKKNPNDADWLKKVYGPEHFTEGSNVGVKCGKASGHRVDVDMDAPEAVRAGQELLPNTKLIHGRPGKPSSHWWFLVPGATSIAYKDLDGTSLIEIRADGGQTVVPPSVHSSGDLLRWEVDGVPLTLTVDELTHAVRATAVAAMFARHWPGAGGRHAAAGHVAGFLLRLGYDALWTQNIVRVIATVAGDDEVADRVRIAKDTAAKYAKDAKTTGGPKLAETFVRGTDLAKRVYEWFGREGEDLLDELNEKHFVAMLGSDAVVVTTRDGRMPIYQSFEQFQKCYYNRYIGKKKVGDWWLEHPQRRTFREVVFAPPPQVASPLDFNTWTGFAVEPDKHPNPEQRCAKFLAHMLRVVCDGVEEHFKFLLDVCGVTCQFPGRPSGVATCLRGDPGAGKGTFIKLFGSLFGIHYTQIDKQIHLTGQFNVQLAGKVVVFADEAFWAGDKQGRGALKRLTTEETLNIERKYRDVQDELNCLHLFMATNEDYAWPAEMKDRRGFMLDVPKKPWMNHAYFAAIRDEWNNGGASAFLALCLQRPVANPESLQPPVTAALIDQQQKTFDPVNSWWLGVLMTGGFGPLQEWPPFIDNTSLYEDYLETARAEGTSRRGSSVYLSHRIQKLLPPGAVQARRYCKVNIAKHGLPELVQQQRRGWVLPPLTDCRKRFDELTGANYPWPAVEPQQPDLRTADAPF